MALLRVSCVAYAFGHYDNYSLQVTRDFPSYELEGLSLAEPWQTLSETSWFRRLTFSSVCCDNRHFPSVCTLLSPLILPEPSKRDEDKDSLNHRYYRTGW